MFPINLFILCKRHEDSTDYQDYGYGLAKGEANTEQHKANQEPANDGEAFTVEHGEQIVDPLHWYRLAHCHAKYDAEDHLEKTYCYWHDANFLFD